LTLALTLHEASRNLCRRRRLQRFRKSDNMRILQTQSKNITLLRILVAAAGVLLLMPAAVLAGKLADVKQAVGNNRRHSNASADPLDFDIHCRDDRDDADENLAGHILGCLIGSAIESAFEANAPTATTASFEAAGFEDAGFEDLSFNGSHDGRHFRPDEPHTASASQFFEEYPYHRGADGLMGEPDWTAPPKRMGAHLGVEYGTDFSGLGRVALGSAAEFSETRVGVDGQWNYYFEDLPDGRSDELHTGDLNLTWRFFSTDQLQVRAGAGLNWMVGDAGDGGFNATLNFSYFPVRPLVLRGELDFGRLGDASLLHGAASVGLMWDRCEIFVGYDYRKIEDTRLINAMSGLHIWF